jgi:hypothetical protein
MCLKNNHNARILSKSAHDKATAEAVISADCSGCLQNRSRRLTQLKTKRRGMPADGLLPWKNRFWKKWLKATHAKRSDFKFDGDIG